MVLDGIDMHCYLPPCDSNDTNSHLDQATWALPTAGGDRPPKGSVLPGTPMQSCLGWHVLAHTLAPSEVVAGKCRVPGSNAFTQK